MEQITINPNNEPYYSEDFIKGFKCGAERQFEADKKEINIAFQHGLEEGVARTLCADRPHGYWIKLGPAEYRCSECGKIQYADDSNELNFCCCCGSDNTRGIARKSRESHEKGADDDSYYKHD